MDLLVLGGTAFLGRAVAAEAVARGHAVTCLARGTQPVASGATLVSADRDRDDALAALPGKRWDAVVEVARQPGHVRRAVRDLDTEHWVFVSTANVYADFTKPEQSEDSVLLDPLEGDVMEDTEGYGAAKVACEQMIQGAVSAAAIVRSGLIGGPGDASGRSGYWPWRFAHPTGDDVLVPGDLDFPVAMVDVRDLTAWLVTLAEQETEGVFNATGPTYRLEEALVTAREVAGGSARFRPVASDELDRLGVGNWLGPRSMPLWISDPDWRWFATMDTTRAAAAGLVCRPLKDTLRDTLDYEESRRTPRRAGLTDEEEREVREQLAW